MGARIWWRWLKNTSRDLGKTLEMKICPKHAYGSKTLAEI
jgi:hypothetical protein